MATNTPDRASNGSPTMFTIPRKPANTTTTALSRGMTAGEDAMLSELQKLVALSSQNPIANQELFSFKANTLLQFLGILAATVFGVFSILAWLAATKSNEISTDALNQALQSNQLALLAYCVSGGNNTSAGAICINVLNQASGEVAPIVASVLPSVPTSPTTTAPTSSPLLQSTEPATTSEASFTSTSFASLTTFPSSSPPTSTLSEATTSSTAASSTLLGATSSGAGAATTTTSSAPSSAPTSAETAKSSSTVSATSATIIGSVVGAFAGIGAVILVFWRWQAYKELLRRSQIQGQEKHSEAVIA